MKQRLEDEDLIQTCFVRVDHDECRDNVDFEEERFLSYCSYAF